MTALRGKRALLDFPAPTTTRPALIARTACPCAANLPRADAVAAQFRSMSRLLGIAVPGFQTPPGQAYVGFHPDGNSGLPGSRHSSGRERSEGSGTWLFIHRAQAVSAKRVRAHHVDGPTRHLGRVMMALQPVLHALAFAQPPSSTRPCSRMDLPIARRPAVWTCSGHATTATPIFSTKPVMIVAQPEVGGRSLRAEFPGLCRMARPNTLSQGSGLIALGAFGARRTAVADGVVGRLCLSALLTAITTAGSMLINDYHDHKLGVDTEWTKPGRPLVTGEVQ